MEDQRELPTPRKDAPKHKGFTPSDLCATSTPRAKGDLNAASVSNNRGTEEEHSDDDDGDDVDKSIDSQHESENVPGTNRERRENSLSRDSNYSPNMSKSIVRKRRAASRSLRDFKPLSSSDPDSEDDFTPKKASRDRKGVSFTVKSYCYFCSVGFVKMARHLLKHIREDPELERAFSLPPHSKERKRIIDHFRTKGNYRHNQEVLKNNSGELKLRRRPTKNKDPVSFLHCPYCRGMYDRNTIGKHMGECPTKGTPNCPKDDRTTVVSPQVTLPKSPSAQNLSPAVKNLLSDMKQDRVSAIVQKDFLLLKLAEHLCDKEPNKQKSVRTRIREMGKFLQALQEKSIISFQDAIDPANFCTVVNCFEKIAGYCTKKMTYTKPSLALKLRSLLKNIAFIVLKLENSDEQMKRDARRFIKLCNEEWNQLIQSALTPLQSQTPKKLCTIPFTRDVQLFYKYLESASASAVESLKTKGDQDAYAALCRVTLAKVSVLNKCAPEVSKMTLKTFQEREEDSQVLSKHFIRINMENREGQTVPLLLTSDLVSAITLLVSKRDACGVHKDNPFLFAKPNLSPTSLYHGRRNVKAFSSECQAKNPEHLQAGRCRKHIARIFQILMLENDELEHLAKLLGHSFRADRDFYQLPKAAVDLAKIAKLILAMEKGCLEKSKGKSLEGVEIEDTLEPDVEQLDPEISEAEEGDEDLQERDIVKQKATREKQRLSEKEDRQLTPGEDDPEVEASGGFSSSAESYNDDDYVPEEERESDDSDYEDIPHYEASHDGSYLGNDHQRGLRKKNNPEPSRKQSFDEQSFDEDEDEDESESSSDEEHKPRSHRSINYCFVCGKAQTKISRHLATHRHDDPDIAEMLKMRKKSKQRHKRLEELRDRGNVKHNETVLSTGYGELKVKRKTPIMPPATKPCPFCKEIFLCREMKKHIRRCFVRKSEKVPSSKNKVLSMVAAAELISSPETLTEVSTLLKSMKPEEISAVILNDSHLMLMAQYLWQVKEKTSTRKGKINKNLKAMGKLLLTLKKTSVSSLEDVMKPENFKHVAEAVRELSEFNEETKSCGKRSFLLTMGLTLKYIAGINYAKALQGGDKQKVDEALAFLKLCFNEWGGFYKSKPTLTIPFILDVQLLFQCMERTAESALESLTKYECAPVYSVLSRVVIAHLMVLNRNVDVCELPLKSFQEREEVEAAASQSQLEKILSAQFIKINVKCNKGKQVTLTLTPALLAALELLESKRETCDVSSDNLFLFAQPGAQGTNLRGRICFNTVVSRCDAEDKRVLRALPFRKHLAQIFKILSLSNDQLSQLAELLGRDIQTDRGYYQKPEAVPDVARLLELLSAMEAGTLERFEGKIFEEIEFADELEPHSESVNPENNEAEGDDDESCQKKGSAKKSRQKSPGSSSRKRSTKKSVEGKKKKRETESEDEAAELEDEEKEGNEEQDEQSEDSGSAKKSEKKTPSSSRKHSSKRPVEGKKKRKETESEDEDEEKEGDPEQDEQSEDPGSAKETSGSSRKHSSKRSLKGQRKRRETESEDEDEGDAEQDEESWEKPEGLDVETPQRTLPCRNEETTNMSYSDNDDDMDVDFDSDEEIPRNEENNGDDDSTVKSPKEKDVKEQEKVSGDTAKKERAAEDTEDQVEEDGEEQSDRMDVDGPSPSPLSDKEKEKKAIAALIGASQMRLIIPKLDSGKLKAPILLSQLFPEVTSAEKDPPVQAEKQKPSTSTDATKISDSEKEIQMICSHCKKIMLKGQTAYQKKGFTDVFCSKECLFEKFPINKPAFRPCYHCHKGITNLSELMMAAVDVKGTMKDFCSMTCLCAFKSSSESSLTQQPTCSLCKKPGTTKCGLMLKEVFYKFCSEICFEGFCRENLAVCAECKSSCYKALKLQLGEETESLCSEKCLADFKKEIQQTHPCTMCHESRLVCDMVTHNIGENVIQLFCGRTCVTSYKIAADFKEIKEQVHSRRKKESKQSAQVSPDAETRTAPTVMVGRLMRCTVCSVNLPLGRKVCPHSCVVAKNRNRKCFNCDEVMSRPHSIIQVPADDRGTMRELCSNKCLASFNSKRPITPCKMCNHTCLSSTRLTLDEHRHKVCSNTCLVNYHRAHNLPLVTCDVCSLSSLKKFTLRTEDGDRLICSDKCLIRIKESIEKPQLCPVCQVTHQMSDMVEDQNDEGVLDFFCSNRCMIVHKAQSLTVSEITSPLVSKEEEEEDVKEEIIALNSFLKIKQEPVEEECNPDFTSLSAENIKEEHNVAKDDLKTEAGAGDSTSTAPPSTIRDAPPPPPPPPPPPCSNCKKLLTDGETSYQKKSCSEIFCSSPCLLKFYQTEEDKTSCTFCLQTITRKTRTVVQAPVDDEGTMKDFCSQTCMFSFNYKRMMTSKLSITPVASHSQCNMCNRYCISKHEVVKDATVHKICSDPCFNRFCNLNQLSICVNCHSDLQTPLTVSMEDCCKHMCSNECLAQFKQKVKTPQPCAMCSTSLQMSEMVESKNSEGEVEFFCNRDCVVASKIKAVSSSGAHVNCDNCGKNTAPECHFTMSDASIRSFCSQSCAMVFKEANTNKTVSTEAAEASDQTQTDPIESPKQLFCAQCHQVMKTPPKVIQEKDKVSFVCSPSCSEEFMKVNKILGKCEQCKKKMIAKIVKRVGERDCFFCSDGCKMHFHQALKKKWGEYCQSCAYCLSISQNLVTERYKRTVERFCSDVCKMRYSLLFRHLSECDSCGLQGRLSQSLSLIGGIKYFCDMTCVLHFCNKLQMKDSPPQPVSTSVSTPVIANVISLAGALANHSSSLSCGSNTQITYSPCYFKTKVVGNASVQTVPTELKNKSTLCTPLVHNKGVSCATQTVDTGAQTDDFKPRDRVLPVPVPIYVPLPLNMYSQFTPKPLCLPLPLPVPVFLPEKPNSLDEALKEKKIQSDTFMEERHLESETEKVQQEKNSQTEREATEEEQQQQEILFPEHPSNHMDEVDTDQQADFNKQEETCVNTSAGLSTQPPEESSPVSGKVVSGGLQSLFFSLETKKNQQISAPAPSSLTQPAEKVHDKNKGCKRQHSPEEAKEETRHRGLYKAVLKGPGRVESQCGIDAWKSWIQWRKHVHFKEEILLCSAAELNNCLCVFIREVKHLDVEPYPPDRIFYLCLCIQQYLFENGRMENIFSDSVYARFSSEFTKMLKGFKPSISASGFTPFYVDVEFLWACKQLGAYSPIVLLNTLLFFCCKSLGFTTVEQHRQLSFTHIVRRTKTNSNNTKSRFLLFYRPTTTTGAGESDEDGVSAQKCKKNARVTMMMENTANPLRCPVRLYEFYLSKCSESVRRHPNLFYLQPVHNCVPSSHLWFSCSPLDDSVMEAMLVRILAIRQMWGEDGGASDQETTAVKTFLPEGEGSD